jgi:N-acetylgalactosamine-6-sulfatase
MHMPTPPRLLRRSFLQTVSLLLPVVGATWPRAAAELPARKPNFIFIMMDDMSWGDVACFGQPYAKTPHLDSLAANGCKFTQFYVGESVCAPSRSALMIGRMPNKAGKPNNGAPRLDPALPNVNNLLKPAGYATGHLGKWHLAKGFALPVGYPQSVVERNEYKIDDWLLFVGPGPTVAKTVTDAALDFIDRNTNMPFHLNVWYLWPHLGVNPSPEQVAVYDDVLDPADPKKRVDVTKFHPTMQAKYNQIKEEHPEYDLTLKMKRYLATITDADTQVGRILAKLEALNLSKDTLVVSCSDNGAVANNITSVPSHDMWPANAGPYRGGKFEHREGGIRMTCLAQWKGRMKGGQVNDSLWRTVDWLPTVCALAGVKTDGIKLDGQNVADILLGAQRERKEPIFWQGAVREGNWKLVKGELYNLETDPSEQENLAKKEPERAQRMSGLLQEWLKK